MVNPPQTQPVNIVAIPADQVTKPSDFFICKPFNNCKLLASACLVRQKDAVTGAGVGANGTKFSKDYLKPCITCADGKHIAKVCGGKVAGSNATLDAATAALPNDPKAKPRKPRKQESTLGQQQESRIRGARASARSKASRKSAERLDAATDEEDAPEKLTFVRVVHESAYAAPTQTNEEQWIAPLNTGTLNAILTGDTPPDAVPATTFDMGQAILPFAPDVDPTRVTTQQLVDAINKNDTVPAHRAVYLGDGVIGWDLKIAGSGEPRVVDEPPPPSSRKVARPVPDPSQEPESDRRTMPALFDIPPPTRPRIDTAALDAWVEATRASLAEVETKLERRMRDFTLQILESIDRLRTQLAEHIETAGESSAELTKRLTAHVAVGRPSVVAEQVADLLTDEGQAFGDLLKRSGMRRDVLRNALARLRRQGRAVVVPIPGAMRNRATTAWVRAKPEDFES